MAGDGKGRIRNWHDCAETIFDALTDMTAKKNRYKAQAERNHGILSDLASRDCEDEPHCGEPGHGSRCLPCRARDAIDTRGAGPESREHVPGTREGGRR